MILTRQREAILEALTASGRPLSRAEILDRARQRISRIGPATVDRNIRELTRAGLIIGVDFPGQPARFELPAGREHPHFVCRYCNRVFDLPVAMELPEVPLPAGYTVEGGEMIFTGRCPDCAEEGR